MPDEVNHVHPFLEEDGRAQLHCLKQFAVRAGHVPDLTRIDRAAWMHASRRFSAGDHAAMTRCIRFALIQSIALPSAAADGARLPHRHSATVSIRAPRPIERGSHCNRGGGQDSPGEGIRPPTSLIGTKETTP